MPPAKSSTRSTVTVVIFACAGKAVAASNKEKAMARRKRIPPVMLARLCAGENRLALFHESAAALDVVLTGEAARHHRLAFGAVDLGARTRELGDDAFHRLHGQRRVLGDEGAVVAHITLELGIGEDTIDEGHLLRLGGGELARGVENLI